MKLNSLLITCGSVRSVTLMLDWIFQMYIALRFMTGFALGLEFVPGPGIYISIYLGIVEIALYNEEGLEDE